MVDTRDLPGVARSSIVTVTVVGGDAGLSLYLTAGRPGDIQRRSRARLATHNTGRLVQVLLSLSLMISILSGTNT